MSDNTLRVDPAVLDDGSIRLERAEQALHTALAKANVGHDDLMSTWRGGTADSAARAWSDVHTRITAHLDGLADHTGKLRSAAAAYRSQDTESGDDLEGQM